MPQLPSGSIEEGSPAGLTISLNSAVYAFGALSAM
jgi:hypothetical protein